MKNLRWEKSNGPAVMNKFQLKTYLYIIFNVLYPNMGNVNPLKFHIDLSEIRIFCRQTPVRF